jgi:hypothetical protein
MGLKEQLVERREIVNNNVWRTPCGRRGQGIEEESFTTDTTTVSDTGVLLCMKCVEKSASDEVGGPD